MFVAEYSLLYPAGSRSKHSLLSAELYTDETDAPVVDVVAPHTIVSASQGGGVGGGLGGGLGGGGKGGGLGGGDGGEGGGGDGDGGGGEGDGGGGEGEA